MNLTELQKADPATYNEIRSIFGAVIVKGELRPKIADDIIQGCLQRAIERRGSSYQLAYQPHIGPDDKHFHAYIWVGQNAFRGDGDSFAEALLAAYLEALHETS